MKVPAPVTGPLVALVAVLLTASATGCGGERIVGQQASAVFVCHDVDAGATCAGDTYATVKPILDRACVPCHFSDDVDAGSNWPLTTYSDIQAWDDTIRLDILDCSMPPPGSGFTMTDKERARVMNWIKRCRTAK